MIGTPVVLSETPSSAMVSATLGPKTPDYAASRVKIFEKALICP